MRFGTDSAPLYANLWVNGDPVAGGFNIDVSTLFAQTDFKLDFSFVTYLSENRGRLLDHGEMTSNMVYICDTAELFLIVELVLKFVIVFDAYIRHISVI